MKESKLAILALCAGNPPVMVDSLHKGTVMQKVCPCHDNLTIHFSDPVYSGVNVLMKAWLFQHKTQMIGGQRLFLLLWIFRSINTILPQACWRGETKYQTGWGQHNKPYNFSIFITGRFHKRHGIWNYHQLNYLFSLTKNPSHLLIHHGWWIPLTKGK